MKIIYSGKFIKEYRKLPKQIKLLAEEKETIFKQNPFDFRLKTHKLKGKLKEFYAFSVAYSWRIIFHFESEDIVGFDTIGTHEIYK